MARSEASEASEAGRQPTLGLRGLNTNRSPSTRTTRRPATAPTGWKATFRKMGRPKSWVREGSAGSKRWDSTDQVSSSKSNTEQKWPSGAV